MKKRYIAVIVILLVTTFMVIDAVKANVSGPTSGTWGGIDWIIHENGTMVISPTKGTPEIDPRTGQPCEVGNWRERVKYKPLAIDENIPYDSSKVTKLIIEEGVTHIGSFVANKMTNLTGELVIPTSVRYIGQEAFKDTKITNLVFANAEADSDNKLCIEAGAFKNIHITSVILPKRLKCMHNWVFVNSKKLEYVHFLSEDIKMGGSPHLDYDGKVGAPFENHGTRQFFAYDYNLKKITFANEATKNNFMKETGSGGHCITLVDQYGNEVYTLDGLVEYASNTDKNIRITKNTTVYSHNSYGKDTITIPNDLTLVVPDGITLTNNGTIMNFGNLLLEGTGRIVNNNLYYTYDVENTTLVSKVPKPIYKIEYDLQGSNQIPSNEFYHIGDAKTFTLTNITKDGYTFKGWSGTGLTGDENIDVVINIPSGNQENYLFVANWIPNNYIIKFDPNGGNGTMNELNVVYDTDIKLTSNVFNNYNKIFIGWNTASDGSGISYTDNQIVKNLSSENGSIITLFAQWKEIQQPIVNNNPPITNNEEIKPEPSKEPEIQPEEEIEKPEEETKEEIEKPQVENEKLPETKNNKWFLIIILIISILSIVGIIVNKNLKDDIKI